MLWTSWGTSAQRGVPARPASGGAARLGQEPQPSGRAPRARPSARPRSARAFLPEAESSAPRRLGGTSLQTLKAEKGQGAGRREGPAPRASPGTPRDKAAAPRTQRDLPGLSRSAPGEREAWGTRAPRGDPGPLSS